MPAQQKNLLSYSVRECSIEFDWKVHNFGAVGLPKLHNPNMTIFGHVRCSESCLSADVPDRWSEFIEDVSFVKVLVYSG